MRIPRIKYQYSQSSNSKGFKFLDLDPQIPVDSNSGHNNKDLLYEYHHIDFFAILVITKGEVNHWVDFKSNRVKTGEILIITKGQVHAFDKESVYHGHLMIFSEEFLQRHFTQSTIKKIPFLYEYLDQKLIYTLPKENIEIISWIQAGLDSKSNLITNQVGALLSYFLLNLVEEKDEDIQYHRNQELFYKFQKLVEANYQKSRNAKDYAIQLNISYKHLNDICKFMCNRTAKRLIDDYVILEAKRHLVLSTYSVKEISFELGFEDPTNFRKYFNKQTGTTPNEFLRRLQINIS
ncbi:AraC family transcriptional regulator [Halosquirtibacter xylanolyticus]|uniref:AraC family transcriptional regulator n=1 Tax=Halosquirtibacter xylanolyticus TaxID=3374599 RepID=UPI003748B9B7|nr:AraC family transcriptional regulator [Prolixibacteraceae bacterium]